MASSNEERAELTLLVDCDYVRENFLGLEDDDDYEEEEDAQEEQELEEEEEEEDAYDLVQHEMRDMQHVSDLEAQQREEEEGGENRYL
jgi:hypothetical protein